MTRITAIFVSGRTELFIGFLTDFRPGRMLLTSEPSSACLSRSLLVAGAELFRPSTFCLCLRHYDLSLIWLAFTLFAV